MVIATINEAADLAGDDLYSVTELGRDLGVSARTIRFYEDKQLISPRRAGNNRVYGARDRARMILILRGKQLGFTLRQIREYLDLYDVDPTHAKQTRLLLKAVQSKISLLEGQHVALLQTLADLKAVEAQTQAALEDMENGAPAPRLDQTKKPAAAAARISQE